MHEKTTTNATPEEKTKQIEMLWKWLNVKGTSIWMQEYLLDMLLK